MSKIIIHNALANQQLDHSHLSSSNKIDKERTEKLRKDLMASHERIYNSPAMQILRSRDKGIHPTAFDK